MQPAVPLVAAKFSLVVKKLEREADRHLISISNVTSTSPDDNYVLVVRHRHSLAVFRVVIIKLACNLIVTMKL
jgi:hypothetical protein